MKENFWVDNDLSEEFAAAARTLRNDKSALFRSFMLEKVDEAKSKYASAFQKALQVVKAERAKDNKRTTGEVIGRAMDMPAPLKEAGKR